MNITQAGVRTRRRFMKFTGCAAVGLAVPVGWLAAQIAPTRCVEAVRSRLYPGPLKRLRDADIKRPGRWGG
ncbi:MAG: twin-arginine translocation signal domain-containing protein [Pirellulales bacterium]|nr:twin-arginine translocation signal domain-containing protein [Pirellulales bacterium]